MRLGILEVSPTTGEALGRKPWFYKYIDSAYRKGILRSYVAARPVLSTTPAGFTEGSQAAFLESAFSRPVRRTKIELLYTRTYEDLKGVTSAMSAQLSRGLAEAISNGYGTRQTARLLVKTVDKITATRAHVIAQTEVIHAHAEGQLDALEDLGVKEVDAEVEFSTAGDDGVCPKCKALQGKTYTLKQARGVIPVHPRCRCTWRPVVGLPPGVKYSKPGTVPIIEAKRDPTKRIPKRPPSGTRHKPHAKAGGGTGSKGRSKAGPAAKAGKPAVKRRGGGGGSVKP